MQLIASDSINIAGRVSADGAPGVISGSYASGSGAGGGILFASDNVTIAGTGIVSATGARQRHHQRQLRLRRRRRSAGASRSSTARRWRPTARSAGTLTKGLLPPIVITSTTHPDPTLTYNDDFNAVALSWNQPYPTRLGYYVLFDRNASNPPTTTNGGQFQANELDSIDPSKLSSGANYFHVVTEDNMSNIGLVESTYRININTAAPNLTSSTHTPAPGR